MKSNLKQEKTQSSISSILFKHFCQPGTSSPKSLHFDQYWTVFRVVLGHFLVNGYRVMRRMMGEEVVVLYKSIGMRSQYLYLKMLECGEMPLQGNFFTNVTAAVRQINHMRREIQKNYSICVPILNLGSWVTIACTPGLQHRFTTSNQTFNSLLASLPKDSYISHSLHPVENFELDPELSQDSQQQFNKLKDLIHHYIDTFGKKYKNNYYVDIQKQCHTSFNVIYLLNTINALIFQQTKALRKPGELGPMYRQIESASWTSFDKTTKQMRADRKDIMLSGNSRMLLLDIIFMKDIKKYVTELYKEETKQLLDESMKTYLETKVKVVKLTNQISSSNKYIYKYDEKAIDGFTHLPTVIDH